MTHDHVFTSEATTVQSSSGVHFKNKDWRDCTVPCSHAESNAWQCEREGARARARVPHSTSTRDRPRSAHSLRGDPAAPRNDTGLETSVLEGLERRC